MSLAEFYDRMGPFLRGTQSLAHTREAIGASPSGDDDFAFYRVLVQRNVFRIMRDLYRPLQELVIREQPGVWTPMLREYEQAHPATGFHPSALGESFSDFLAERRQQHPEQLVIFEEMADFLWVRQAVYTAPDDAGDGFDQRLFVRHYTYRIHEFVGALEGDPQVPLPEPQALILIVYRHASLGLTRFFQPSAAGLVALAKRQGAPVPAPLQAVPEPQVAQADADLVGHGVLTPR